MKWIEVSYVWLDGNITPQLRSKIKLIEVEDEQEAINLSMIPEWSYDGSSCNQAEVDNSDLILRPYSLSKTPWETFVVFCEVFNPDGKTPHETNYRASLRNILKENPSTRDYWFGVEQEYVINNVETNTVLGWEHGTPAPQGPYYCGVGGQRTVGRTFVNEHYATCKTMGIPIAGANAEVMLGQWEYQIGYMDALTVADNLWLARYMAEIISERYKYSISLEPKPKTGDWNGSGAHINFSTPSMRMAKSSSMEYLESVCDEFKKHPELIHVYGEDNNLRLTGKHETAHINDCTYGVSDRTKSIRIPVTTANEGRGYLEDRRPGANVDPFQAFASIIGVLQVIPEGDFHTSDEVEVVEHEVKSGT
jgi:glutamine synthetase